MVNPSLKASLVHALVVEALSNQVFLSYLLPLYYFVYESSEMLSPSTNFEALREFCKLLPPSLFGDPVGSKGDVNKTLGSKMAFASLCLERLLLPQTEAPVGQHQPLPALGGLGGHSALQLAELPLVLYY